MDADTKREIILDYYSNPFNKEKKEEGYIKANGNNISCIDDINIFIKINNNIIEEAFFDGEACAISTSSVSIMLKNIIGKTVEEALSFTSNFENMINEKEYDKELLGEANVYDEIYKQENRKGCATLPYVALKKAIEQAK